MCFDILIGNQDFVMTEVYVVASSTPEGKLGPVLLWDMGR